MKWCGLIGFVELEETAPGVWNPSKIIEKKYYGDLIRNSRRLQTVGDKVNDDININNQISIVANPYAYSNFHSIKYAEFMGTKWKVTDIEVQYPRLILSLGGMYNE